MPLPAYLAALRLDPSNVETHLLLGELYLKRGDAGNALAELERALTLDPADARAHSGLAEVHLGMGRFAESVQAAERALDMDPADSRTRYIRARALVRLGMREEGRLEMVRYRELLANEEQDGQAGRDLRAIGKRAAERFVGGERGEAIAALESLVETDPDQAIPRLNLGVAQRKSGLSQAAVDTFEAMVAGGFGDAMVHRNLTMEYAALGDTAGPRPASGYLFPENRHDVDPVGQLTRISHELSATAPDPSASATARILAPGA